MRRYCPQQYGFDKRASLIGRKCIVKVSYCLAEDPISRYVLNSLLGKTPMLGRRNLVVGIIAIR